MTHLAGWGKRLLWPAGLASAAAVCGALVGSGRVSAAIEALLLAAAPILAYWGLANPFVFPYGLYVALIPFDTLFKVAGFGSASKLLGAVSGLALLWYALRLKQFNPFPATVLVWSLYAAWCTMTIMWALVPGVAAGGVLTLVQLLLLYAIIAITPASKRDLDTVLTLVVSAALVAAAYGGWTFYHQHGGDRLDLRSASGSVDANHFADALIFPAVALIVGTISAKGLVRRALRAAGLAVIVGGIYFSGSRETLVALGVVLVYLMVVASRHRWGLLLVGALAGAVSFIDPVAWARFGQAADTGGSGRTSIWSTGLRAARDHWFGGAGFANFGEAYNERYLDGIQFYPAGWSRAAHDIVVSTLVEVGIVGALLLVIAFAAQFVLLSGIRPDDELHPYKLIANGGLIGLLVAAIFIDMVTYKYLWFAMSVAAQVYGIWAHRRWAERAGTRWEQHNLTEPFVSAERSAFAGR